MQIQHTSMNHYIKLINFEEEKDIDENYRNKDNYKQINTIFFKI